MGKMTLEDDSLEEIDDIYLFKQFIKEFILSDTSLFRHIYFPYSTPLDEDKYPYPENPYIIFDEVNGSHGIVKFGQKEDAILNEEMPIILIDFASARYGDSYFLADIFITIRIICKGTGIQTLANGRNRSGVIAKLIDRNLNLARINNIGEVHKNEYKGSSINEENSFYLLQYVCRGCGTNVKDNVNYNLRKYGVKKL